ncbi:MAG: 60S ribosomal subunit assembly/export protein [Pycnora praestabilis]|nr:MAG: 60S ribosomal subunit assembly/export protein [Pycnora praestabilis]
MAPSRTTTVKTKPQKGSSTLRDGKSSSSSKGPSKNGASSSKNRISKSKPKGKAPPPKQQKTKASQRPLKTKRRIYSEKELGVPTLNMITPVGVEKPKGKKKGKVFVDDRESMMTILAMVNADKEGQIESKMMKARQMEEIREARKKEAEARQEVKKSKLEDTKDSIRRKRKRRSDEGGGEDSQIQKGTNSRSPKANRKTVSFA